jgi:hypothetical protein
MKIFFNASLTGKKIYLNEYTAIFNEIKQIKGSVILHSPLFVGSPEKVAAETEEQASTYFHKLQGWIKQCDIAIFEASYPSLGVGHEIAMALQFEKPVIVLYLPNKKPFILEGVSSDKLQLIEYGVDDLHELVTESVGYAVDQQDTRFNFFISPKIGSYLDWVSKQKRLPRAVYLRKLIEEDMKKNRDYEE